MVLAARAEPARDYVVATGESHSVEEFVAAAFRCVGIDDWASYVEVDPALLRPADADRAGRRRDPDPHRPRLETDRRLRRDRPADGRGRRGPLARRDSPSRFR